jgi:hypothetical protein
MMSDFPFVPPNVGASSWAVLSVPTSRQVSSGLYFINKSVVGSSKLIVCTKLSLLGPTRSIPLRDSPATLTSSLSSCGACVVTVALVVLNADTVSRMFCAAAL